MIISAIIRHFPLFRIILETSQMFFGVKAQGLNVRPDKTLYKYGGGQKIISVLLQKAQVGCGDFGALGYLIQR
jgi:hypothetical protein